MSKQKRKTVWNTYAVFKYRQLNYSYQEIADLFDKSVQWVNKLISSDEYKGFEGGDPAPKDMGKLIHESLMGLKTKEKTTNERESMIQFNVELELINQFKIAKARTALVSKGMIEPQIANATFKGMRITTDILKTIGMVRGLINTNKSVDNKTCDRALEQLADMIDRDDGRVLKIEDMVETIYGLGDGKQ